MVAVHIAGRPVEIERLVTVLEPHGIAVVEDAAHAFPSRIGGSGGRYAGTFGRAGAFSFYATKTITTGEGGMLVTDDDAIADRARVMSLHGISRDAWNRYTASGSWYYEIEDAGYKYNMTDIAAALGIVQLERAEELLAARRSIAAAYIGGVSSVQPAADLLELPEDALDGSHAWHLYIVRLKLERLTLDRAEVMAALSEAGSGPASTSSRSTSTRTTGGAGDEPGGLPGRDPRIRARDLAADLARDDRGRRLPRRRHAGVDPRKGSPLTRASQPVRRAAGQLLHDFGATVISFADDVPWLLPGSLIALVVSLLAARPVGRWMGVSPVVAGVMILNLGVFLAATLTPPASGFSFEVAVARTCDMSRIGLASPADWFNPPDTAGNMVVLIPLGFAIALIPRSRRKAAVLIGAIALPFVIESSSS